MRKRPSIDAPRNGPLTYSVPGCSASGTLKVSPSSPPVISESCEASVRNAEATASVIMAKKIALTRRLNRPITNDSSAESASAPSAPMASASQVGPSRVVAMAMP